VEAIPNFDSRPSNKILYGDNVPGPNLTPISSKVVSEEAEDGSIKSKVIVVSSLVKLVAMGMMQATTRRRVNTPLNGTRRNLPNLNHREEYIVALSMASYRASASVSAVSAVSVSVLFDSSEEEDPAPAVKSDRRALVRSGLEGLELELELELDVAGADPALLTSSKRGKPREVPAGVQHILEKNLFGLNIFSPHLVYSKAGVKLKLTLNAMMIATLAPIPTLLSISIGKKSIPIKQKHSVVPLHRAHFMKKEMIGLV